MANLSDFFPAAGGGGGIGQTITIGDYSYPNARPLAEMAENRLAVYASDHRSCRTYAPSGSSPYNYAATIPVNSVYVTVADVTGASNGGALTGLGGYSYYSNTNFATVFTVRITLDGGTPVEYIFDPTVATQRSYAFAMGSYEILSRHSTYGATGNLFFGGGGTNILAGWSSSNNFRGSAPSTTYPSSAFYIIDPLMALHKGAPYIYFNTSCKVEVKQTASALTGSISNAAIYTF